MHFLSFPYCATCPAYLILVDFIAIMIFGEAEKLRNFSLCYLLQLMMKLKRKVKVKLSLCLTKYHAMKMYHLLN